MIKVLSFKNIYSQDIYFILHRDEIYRSTYSQATYTLKEAMDSPNLVIHEYEIVN